MNRRRAYGVVVPALIVSALTASVLGACHRYVTVEEQRERLGLTTIGGSSSPSGGVAAGGSNDPISSIVKQDEENRKNREKLDVTGAGSALERVTSEPVDEFAPAVSRDGKQLLFQVETYDSVAAKLKQQTLVGVDPNTRGQRTIYTSTARFSNNPVWMPDGASYLYVTNPNGSKYALVRALTSAPNAAIGYIVNDENLAPLPSHPSPSGDGSRVAFTTTASDGAQSICTIGIDGSRLAVLGEGRAPAFSPEGSSIAFVRKVSGFDQIYLVDGDKGTNLVQLTSERADSDMPAWSPDGQYIAFASNRGFADQGKKPDEVMHLFVMKKDGTGLVQLTSGQSLSGAPAWSTDGWLYFASNQAGNYDIWRIKLAGALAELSGPGGKKPPEPIKPTPSASAPPEASVPPPPDTAPTASAKPPEPSAGCLGDWDCKGDRVCDKGQCVSAPAPAPSSSSKKK